MKNLQVSMFWLGPPSNYNPKDEALGWAPEGDLGGRYMALPISRPPEKLFDDMIGPLKAVYTRATQASQWGGGTPAEAILVDAIRATWIFASQEITRLTLRINELETRLAKLEPKETS